MNNQIQILLKVILPLHQNLRIALLVALLVALSLMLKSMLISLNQKKVKKGSNSPTTVSSQKNKSHKFQKENLKPVNIF